MVNKANEEDSQCEMQLDQCLRELIKRVNQVLYLFNSKNNKISIYKKTLTWVGDEENINL